MNYHVHFLEWVDKIGTESQIFTVKNYVLGVYSFLSMDEKIIGVAKDLLTSPNIEEEPSIVGIMYSLKEVYRRNEQFEDLLKILPMYHQYSKKYGYIYMGEHSVFGDIAYVHYSLKNYDKAIKAYKRFAQDMEDGGDYFQKSSVLNNIGLCFYQAKKKDSANYYFDKALQLIYLKKEHYSEYPIKVGFTVPKRSVKLAVNRNRIKRLIREAYRVNKQLFSKDLEEKYIFMFIYMAKEEIKLNDLELSIKKICDKFLIKIKEDEQN